MAFFLKTKIWQTGSLDWWGFIDGEDVFLGSREFPMPAEEGDRWVVRSTGDVFKVEGGEILRDGHEEPPQQVW